MKLLEITKSEANNEETQKKIDMQAISYMEKMTLIFKNLKPISEERMNEPHILEEIFAEMWPLIENLLRKYAVKTNFDKFLTSLEKI